MRWLGRKDFQGLRRGSAWLVEESSDKCEIAVLTGPIVRKYDVMRSLYVRNQDGNTARRGERLGCLGGVLEMGLASQVDDRLG